MRIHLVAVGRSMPRWVAQGFEDYARRLPHELGLELRPVVAPRRARGRPAGRIRDEESRRLLAAVPPGARRVALDERGRPWSTAELAGQLRRWLADGRDVALLVGGPDGLAPGCLAGADDVWSLSRLTLPHMLVRVVLAEQLYRAWTILSGHPYHRDGDPRLEPPPTPGYR